MVVATFVGFKMKLLIYKRQMQNKKLGIICQ